MSTTSAAKQEANRANAQLSTGPTSPEGKAKVSLNAVKTGLTGRTVLLPSDDVAAYEALLADFQTKWQPATPEEQRLTQALLDTEWRLLRLPGLETGILSLGYRELAHEFVDIEDPGARRNALHARVFLAYMRPLTNLQTQESRLRRNREKDTAALEKLQYERLAAQKKKLTEAAKQYIEAVEAETNDEWTPALIQEKFGFEFSIGQIEVRALELQPKLFDAWCRRNGKNRAA